MIIIFFSLSPFLPSLSLSPLPRLPLSVPLSLSPCYSALYVNKMNIFKKSTRAIIHALQIRMLKCRGVAHSTGSQARTKGKGCCLCPSSPSELQNPRHRDCQARCIHSWLIFPPGHFPSCCICTFQILFVLSRFSPISVFLLKLP